jgi:predicted pyridoxine 5'-phosphate oxidase superfamily flavin-nucleotide-binding protein
LTALTGTQFHAGEGAAQTRAGAAPRAAAIRDWMPDQHRQFFAVLPFVVAATLDKNGWPIATIFVGLPGFTSSPDAKTLRIAALPDRDDPAAPWLKPGAPIGLLGIDFATRRRNRANGVIADTECGLLIAVSESFGNCAQYINVLDTKPNRAVPQPPELMDRLDPLGHDVIAAADTLFCRHVGRRRRRRHLPSRRQARLRPRRPRHAHDPDFAGNRYFNTLGNMMLDPRAALLFADFSRGDLLQVQGHTEIVWEVPEDERLAGAERLWRLNVSRIWRRRGALPLRGSLQMLSPSVARTGSW